ncbi:MAG: hypothetical protein M1817_001471 [Caeruleum heppii]|nr:MAG: hypothetical protein M1817_001471 [Caeruleum heppii]
MEGLPVDMGEDDISKILRQNYDLDELEEVRVIKDRGTGVSKQFGFLHFRTVAGAGAFLEQSYPSIRLSSADPSVDGPKDNREGRVRVSFCRERDDRERAPPAEEEWKCHICAFPNFARRAECRRCQAQRDDAIASNIAQYSFVNTGESDISPDNTPSQFLIFRGLEPSVTEELLAKGAIKLDKPSGSSPPPQSTATKKTGAKVASTTGDSNLGAKEGTLMRVLLVKDRQSNDSWRYGFAEYASIDDAQAALTKYNSVDKFTISSKPVTLSFIHTGVFIPAYNYDSSLEKFTFSPLNNPAMKLVYWDEQAYVSELVLAAPSNSAPAVDDVTGPTKRPGASDADGLVKSVKENEGKVKKRKADTAAAASSKKSAPAHLNFWRDRHAELHGIQSGDKGPSDSAIKTSKSTTRTSSSEPPAQSYANLTRKCCFLCSRQFKTEAEVNKHERLSQLHRDNLKNDELRTQAQRKLDKAAGAAGRASQASGGDDVDGGESGYRDRAKERRAAFGQPKQPASSKATSSAPAAVVEPDDPTPAPSKGASLLNKMGWSAGSGLGAEGTGAVEPVATDLYVQGVGLGADGGKVGDAIEQAERNTKGGYREFVERGKEGARERFEKLG